MRHPTAHLANLDLNLLVTLRELLRERNVTRAAARIGVTQPAVSASLSRLRRHFDDELLVRRRNGYTLTPLAAQLADQVEAVCAAAERLFGTGHRFDPGSSQREFTLLMADYTVGVLGSRLSAALTERAPGVALHIRLVREAFAADIAETIRLIDGMVAPPAGRFDLPELRSVALFTDRWVCVVDRANPVADEGPPTVERLAALPWVVPFQPDRGFSAAAPMSRQLALLGIQPAIRVRVESYLAVPPLVAGTDRVALVQERLAAAVAEPLGLRVLDCPGEPAPLVERLWWHSDMDGDPAHRWLRELVVELTSRL
ncbi:LysR substrate-binding domain-containing protein [Pseudonocardia kujensis]|uniref:LysR family transcriptional regulator n=1 Tax=Pseudonocardia kujensis TaxID=1128675 RepID=UPI001E584440|nr:LysR family transcriptional regulator [Pseudonocardia kujensis]MCE0762717.1 LysR substrate-binding domain-containing protein [Pseudonocardia kujensis]